MTAEPVETQVIASLVVRNPNDDVLFVRYDPDNEKWWLPGGDVAPFTHPDDAADGIAAAFDGLEMQACRFSHVESFRGRRGWHLVFHYDVRAGGTPGGRHEAAWFPADALPRTVHGGWEKRVVSRVASEVSD